MDSEIMLCRVKIKKNKVNDDRKIRGIRKYIYECMRQVNEGRKLNCMIKEWSNRHKESDGKYI